MPGDIMCFYASKTIRGVIAIGVVDAVYTDFDNSKEVLHTVRKRTVYELSEIQDLFKPGKTIVIVFKHYVTLDKRIPYTLLVKEKLLNRWPQSITKINADKMRSVVQNLQGDV